MTGFFNELQTKQDYLNAAAYVMSAGEGGGILAARLEGMKVTTSMMSLKASAKSKKAEKQQQEDYEPVWDPNCEMRRLGFTDAELDCLIERMRACSD